MKKKKTVMIKRRKNMEMEVVKRMRRRRIKTKRREKTYSRREYAYGLYVVNSQYYLLVLYWSKEI